MRYHLLSNSQETIAYYDIARLGALQPTAPSTAGTVDTPPTRLCLHATLPSPHSVTKQQVGHPQQKDHQSKKIRLKICVPGDRYKSFFF